MNSSNEQTSDCNRRTRTEHSLERRLVPLLPTVYMPSRRAKELLPMIRSNDLREPYPR